MFSFRTHAIICATLFGALIGIPIVGNTLVASGMLKEPDKPSLWAMVLIFGLFLAFAFSAVPVMVMTVMKAQTALGGEERSELVRQAVARQRIIIWLIWALMAAGSLVGLPAAIRDGMFSQ